MSKPNHISVEIAAGILYYVFNFLLRFFKLYDAVQYILILVMVQAPATRILEDAEGHSHHTGQGYSLPQHNRLLHLLPSSSLFLQFHRPAHTALLYLHVFSSRFLK